jgi:hypothetical protein
MEDEKTSLNYMIDIFKKAPEIYQPSHFWENIK